MCDEIRSFVCCRCIALTLLAAGVVGLMDEHERGHEAKPVMQAYILRQTQIIITAVRRSCIIISYLVATQRGVAICIEACRYYSSVVVLT